MSYIKENFLLTTKTAEKLYFNYAKDMPIFDYHCHLPEKQILANEGFNDVYEIWLAGDHYKWRLMRNYGVNEEYITGNTSHKEKFIAYCTVLGTAFGNPLYHWSQVELKEFFNCEIEINEENAELIWDWCNEYIRLNNITPQKLIENSNVSHLFTTNEAIDDLSTFPAIAEKGYKFKVIPAFRADKALAIETQAFNGYIGRLAALTHKIESLDELLDAIAIRVEAFKKVGTTASDIAAERVPAIPSKGEADEILKARLSGAPICKEDAEKFRGYMLYALMKLYATKGLVTELHVGPMRNNNSRMMAAIGPDTGFDSISDENSIKTMSRLFDRLDGEGCLPKTIVFNLNPKMNTEIMTLIGSFQTDEARGKLQYGPAWWFLDNKVGMEKHLEDLTATGHIATFVGMLTDSRSLLSYPRHHYFRRILCNYLGGMMERGEMTQDEKLVGRVIKDVCYHNAIKYLGMEK